MAPQDLLDQFSVRIYSPPLSEVRTSGAIADLSNPLHVAMLLIDFETEVSMNGVVDFIGNSIGQYLPETIQALRLVGQGVDAELLSEISTTASAAGMTHEAIQADRSSLAMYAVTSFKKLHGDKWDQACKEIQSCGSRLDFEGIMAAVLRLVEANQTTFAKALATAGEA